MSKVLELLSDVDIVDGVYKHNHRLEKALYNLCKQYYDDHYIRVFSVGSQNRDDIFQESMVILWQNIENRKIYVENGKLMGRGGNIFHAKLTTYFMAIAVNKYKEIVNDESLEIYSLDKIETWREIINDSEKDEEASVEEFHELLLELIAEMPKLCNHILMMFYYKKYSLDHILSTLPSFNSKNALKTHKYKCMENLKKRADIISKRLS